MSDENNFHTNLEEHEDILVETQPKDEPEQMTVAEGHETETLPPRQEKSGKKLATTPKAIRLATISKLLEKHTTQMDRVGRMVQPLQTQTDKIAKMVQPLQKQLKSLEGQTASVKQLPYQIKQLQKQMSQVQKDSQKIRLLVSKTNTSSTKKKKTKKKGKR